MTSREEIHIALLVKRVQVRTARLESACKHKDVAGMLTLAAELEPVVQELREELRRVNERDAKAHSG